MLERNLGGAVPITAPRSSLHSEAPPKNKSAQPLKSPGGGDTAQASPRSNISTNEGRPSVEEGPHDTEGASSSTTASGEGGGDHTAVPEEGGKGTNGIKSITVSNEEGTCVANGIQSVTASEGEGGKVANGTQSVASSDEKASTVTVATVGRRTARDEGLPEVFPPEEQTEQPPKSPSRTIFRYGTRAAKGVQYFF